MNSLVFEGFLTVCDVIQEVLRKKLKNRSTKRKRVWITPLLSQRSLLGASVLLCNEFKTDDDFLLFFRIDRNQFEWLLNEISPIIEKQDSAFRKCLNPRIKLQITLRFLATGDSYKSLEFFFRVSDSAISLFITEVCNAISETLKSFIEVSGLCSN